LIDTEKCNFDEHKELKTGSIPKARYKGMFKGFPDEVVYKL
jgi:hypothetical protein